MDNAFQVVKFGTNTLFQGNAFQYDLLKKKAEEIKACDEQYDLHTILVVSGAIRFGKLQEKVTEDNRLLSNVALQGYASVGQRLLMDALDSCFERSVAQVLLTNMDLKNKNDLHQLLLENARRGRISAINYNDTLDFAAVRTDNDTLAGTIASYVLAKRLVILGNYDGFLDDSGEVISHISEVSMDHYALCKGVGENGTGGFEPKLRSAELVLNHGGEAIISNASYNLLDVIEGTIPRTLFRK